MNKILAIVAVFFAVLVLSRLTISEAQTSAVCKPGDVNPNGSSELSLLMRFMDDHAAAARKDVLAKKKSRGFPREFLAIYTATPTDSTTKQASFNPFADLYMSSLNDFQASTAGNLVENYNNVVSACLSCHSQHCPGPVSRIKKLMITEAGK